MSNAAYGVLDYAAYPLAMLLAAPALIHHLGGAQYGVWIVCTAAISTGGTIAAGFGDANIQHIASQRGNGNVDAVVHAVRSMMGINLALGSAMALLALALAPTLSRHVVSPASTLYLPCLWSLRVACVLMIVRALESVCISTQRAFELYGRAVRVSILARVATVAMAVVAAEYGYGVAAVMLSTFVLMTLGTAIQLFELRGLVSADSLWPSFDRTAYNSLLHFGTFSWLQAVSTVIFSQADRLILGVSLGAASVTSYALCVQMTQPIYGVAAAGLHFLFPYLASRRPFVKSQHLGRAVLLAFFANLAFILISTAAVLLVGTTLLHAWVGEVIANSSAPVLAPIAWSFALLGLNVTAYYSLLALGRVRAVAAINLVGGAAMLLATAWLLPHAGIRGVAMARLFYGSITLVMYYPVVRTVFFAPQTSAAAAGMYPVCEDA